VNPATTWPFKMVASFVGSANSCAAVRCNRCSVLANAASVGANTVSGPALSRASTSPAVFLMAIVPPANVVAIVTPSLRSVDNTLPETTWYFRIAATSAGWARS